jgi:OCT family organic cation transporter-like MFS transporter 18
MMGIVYLNVALYATCYQLQRPIEPYLVERLGAGRPGCDAAASYAALQSFFSAVQTVGNFVVGILVAPKLAH